MATPRSQRIGIWIITVVMAIGAVGVYFVAILANNNDSNKTAQTQQVYAEYQQKVSEQAKKLSEQYYAVFSQYASRVHSFDKAVAEDKLVTEDLKEGDGEVVGDATIFAAYYIGWNPDGKVFDQSIEGSSLKAPLPIASGLVNASLIAGWKDGMKGMKIGGVRELTIPSDEAYGSTGQGADIPADTPIRFVVMAIPPPEEIPLPAELLTGI